MGVNITLVPEQAKKVFDAAGIVFLLAPVYHAALKNVIVVRKELKIRTIFNVLGPFANPASTKRQLIGVPNADIAKTMAKVASKLGYERVIIVTSKDGTDEISLSDRTLAYDVGRSIKKFEIDPRKLGFKKASLSDLQGGSADDNAGIIRAILAGAKGPQRDVVVLNAAFGLLVAGIAKTPKEGIALAEKSIDTGSAKSALERLVVESNKFSAEGGSLPSSWRRCAAGASS